jgi:hypothetical protein
MKEKIIKEFIKFAESYTHTLGENQRLRQAAKDFLNPPKKFSFSKYLKKHL